MLDRMNQVLRAVLTPALPQSADLRFDTPASTWPQELTRPTVSLFLHRITRDLRAQTEGWVERRDEHGTVLDRRPPVRVYQLCYLVTAWAARPDEELDVLGTALVRLSETGPLGADLLALLDLEPDTEVSLTVAHPGLPAVPVELWSGLGIPPRPSFDLVALMPLTAPKSAPLAPAVDTLELGTNPSADRLVPLPTRAGRRRARIQEGPIR